MFHGATALCALKNSGYINPMYFLPTGYQYMWLLLYILSGCCVTTVNAVIHETPVILSNPVLQDFPGYPGF